MKIRDYLPELPSLLENQNRMSELANIMMMSKSQGQGETARLPSLGSSQTFINSWLRQQMAYRQQMVNDLMMLALTVEEIRSPLNHLTGEVFRRGIHWLPKFVQKCNQCDIEFSEYVTLCPKCNTSDFSEPDPDQKTRFNAFKADANIWSQSLEEVLKFFYFDLNAIDDAYLYIAKEYFAPEGEKNVRSRPLELRRLNPAAVELDLNPMGLPKAQTWICYMHRPTANMAGAMGTYGANPAPQMSTPQVSVTESAPGYCEECGRELVPAMYKYLHQGATQYLLDDEVIHVKKFHPDETYGWSPLLTIFEKILSIKGMDQYVYRYFFERKMPSSMVMVFTDDPEGQGFIKQFFWIVPFGFAFHGLSQLVSASCNALNRPFHSTTINIMRLFLLLIPLVYLGSQIWSTTGFFVGIALGNLATSGIAWFWFRVSILPIALGNKM